MKAIRVVHDHGFLHNDLQPCNVYLQYGRRVENMDAYQVKLGGFAKCQSIDRANSDCLGTSYELEESNALIKSTEVLVSGGKKTSTKSDIWSLGIMIYACLLYTSPSPRD